MFADSAEITRFMGNAFDNLASFKAAKESPALLQAIATYKEQFNFKMMTTSRAIFRHMDYLSMSAQSMMIEKQNLAKTKDDLWNQMISCYVKRDELEESHRNLEKEVQNLRERLTEAERKVAAVPPAPKAECPVCFSDYGDGLIPLVGTCGHSVCEMCRPKLCSQKKCPFCRKPRKFWNPIKNYLAIELLTGSSATGGV